MKGNNNNGKSRKGQLALSRDERKFFTSERDSKSVKVERRRCTLVNVITGVTGSQAAYAVASNNCSAAFEFSNYAALYQEYRVRAIRTRVVPRFRDNIQAVAATPYPGTVVSGGFVDGVAGGTYAAVFAEANSKVHPEWTVAENLVTWELNPNAKLWTAVGTTLATANQYGVQFLSTSLCPAFYNTVVVYDTFTEFDVEFRTRS